MMVWWPFDAVDRAARQEAALTARRERDARTLEQGRAAAASLGIQIEPDDPVDVVLARVLIYLAERSKP